MFDMVADGKACFKIAKVLNENSVPTKAGKKWEARTVSRIVRNSAYCGLTYFGQTRYEKGKRINLPSEKWVELPDATPAIITKVLFDKAQAAMAKSKILHPGKAKHEYPLTGFAICGKCGSPLVGSCLYGDYRYYHCRGTYPTASRKPICKEHYIKAVWLENEVWNKVKVVLSSPEVLLNELGKLTEAEQTQFESGALESEIKELTRNMKSYAGQERVMMNMLRRKLVTPDVVLDEINQMKQERTADEKKLNGLLATKENVEKAEDLKAHLKELCAKIVPDIDACTFAEKREAYKYLDLKVVATSEGADIKGYVQPCLITTGQTWARVLTWRYSWPDAQKVELSVG
jgi:site-specific DNA recombinase